MNRFDHRGRSHSGSAADRSHLRPPVSPQRHPPPSQQSSSPPTGLKLQPVKSSSKSAPSSSSNWSKFNPLQYIGRIVTPNNSSHSSDATASDPTVKSVGAAVDEPLSSQPQASAGKSENLAARIKNFERRDEPGSEPGYRGRSHSKSEVDESESQRYTKGGRALVSVQIGEGHGEGERERGEEKQKEKEDEQRRRRQEEMRRLRREEDRLQRERRKKEAKKKALLSDYENVDLSPPSPVKSKPHSKGRGVAKTSPAESRKRIVAEEMRRDNYENVAIHYTRSDSHSPESPKMASGPSSGRRGGRHRDREKRGVASGAKQLPKMRHQYENITILTSSGPMPYLHDSSSSEDSEDFSGEESPAPKKVIYENVGLDKSNHNMSAEEIERHLRQQEKRGISAEYLRIKNEPLLHPCTACR